MANKTVPVTAGLATCRVRYLFSTYYFTQIIKIFSLNVKKKKIDFFVLLRLPPPKVQGLDFATKQQAQKVGIANEFD